MSTLLEKLVGAKALLDAAIEEEIARTRPAPAVENPAGDCQHINREEITGAGAGKKTAACVDCGESWEVE